MLMQGGCDEVMHYYIAQVSLPDGVQPGTHGLPGEGEDTRVLVVPAEEAFRMVAENRIANVTAATLILWLQVNAARLRREWAI
jgi:ADP-ribose pyrophosphatase